MLDAPTPTEDESLRALALLAVAGRGALTEAAIREHWRLKGGKARLHHHVVALVDEGALREVAGRRRRRAVLVAAGRRARRRRRRRRCSSARSTTWSGTGRCSSALFGFDHLIEVYKREHERVYGYYVLPLLAGDRFVGRADLKADRAEGVLRVRRFTPEPKVRGDVDAKLERAATRLARVARARAGRTPRVRHVPIEEARRIAVRAQLLDGSATGVLETVRRLGFLQLDPISTVAPPQHLVLWSRLGPFDRAELDRLLWEERKLVEWNAFLYPIEDLPLLRARMRRRDRPPRAAPDRVPEGERGRSAATSCASSSARAAPLPRDRGPRRAWIARTHRWWGSRKMGLMLSVLNARGEVAVVGRRGEQRVWDLAERWYPETETLSWAQAERLIEEQRFRALGVQLERGRLVAHPDATDGPVAERITFLSPFDRLVHDRARTEALWDFCYRLEMYVPKAKREYGYYVLPILARRPAHRPDRAGARPEGRRAARARRLVGGRRAARVVSQEPLAAPRDVPRRID